MKSASPLVKQQRIMPELDALQAAVDALKHLQTKIAEVQKLKLRKLKL